MITFVAERLYKNSGADHDTYPIDMIDDVKISYDGGRTFRDTPDNKTHYEKIAVYGDEALRDRIVAFLNTEPVMYACGNQWYPINTLEVLQADIEAPQIYAVHLVPISS